NLRVRAGAEGSVASRESDVELHAYVGQPTESDGAEDRLIDGLEVFQRRHFDGERRRRQTEWIDEGRRRRRELPAVAGRRGSFERILDPCRARAEVLRLPSVRTAVDVDADVA